MSAPFSLSLIYLDGLGSKANVAHEVGVINAFGGPEHLRNRVYGIDELLGGIQVYALLVLARKLGRLPKMGVEVWVFFQMIWPEVVMP